MRDTIIEKLNAIPEQPVLEFTQAEIEWMLERFIKTHTKRKISKSKMHTYIGKSNTERIGFKVVLK
jgi:hypothetical protein